jgi:hypothetical protein
MTENSPSDTSSTASSEVRRIIVGSLKPGKGSITLDRKRLIDVGDLETAGFLPLMQRGLKAPEYQVTSSEDFESNSVTIFWIDGPLKKENN